MTNCRAGDPSIIESVILSGRIAKHDAKRQCRSGYLIRIHSKQKLKEFPLLTLRRWTTGAARLGQWPNRPGLTRDPSLPDHLVRLTVGSEDTDWREAGVCVCVCVCVWS